MFFFTIICVSNPIGTLQAGSKVAANELVNIHSCSHFVIVGDDAVSLEDSPDSPPDSPDFVRCKQFIYDDSSSKFGGKHITMSNQ